MRLFSFSRRFRLLSVAVALVGLLFQQLAMAGYICPQTASSATMDGCAGMRMSTPSHSQVHVADPRCGEHCVHHVPSPSHARVAAPTFVLVALAFSVPVRSALRMAADWRIPGLNPHPPNTPLSLRFCSLLI